MVGFLLGLLQVCCLPTTVGEVAISVEAAMVHVLSRHSLCVVRVSKREQSRVELEVTEILRGPAPESLISATWEGGPAEGRFLCLIRRWGDTYEVHPSLAVPFTESARSEAQAWLRIPP